MLDFNQDVGRHRVIRIANRQVKTANRRPAPGFHDRRTNKGRRFVAGHLGRLQAFKLFGFRSRLRCRIRIRPVLINKPLQLLLLGNDSRVRPLVPFTLFGNGLQISVDRTGIHRELATSQIQCVAAGRREKRAVVRDDETCFPVIPQKVFQQNLRSQVEEVRRFVQQQQIGFVQQQGRQLDSRLPASRKLREWSFEVRAFDFELAGDLAALPVRLPAVPHQELQCAFTWLKRVVLPEITEPQAWMTNDLAAVEFFFTEQDAQQRRFAGSIAANETDFDIIDQGRFGTVQQHLLTIALVSVPNLQQHSHSQLSFCNNRKAADRKGCVRIREPPSSLRRRSYRADRLWAR